MLQTIVDRPGDRDPGGLHEAYLEALRDAVASADPERVASESGVDTERLDDLLDGRAVELTLSEAAALLAATADGPDADAVAAEARDELLLGMTTAVLDVDAIAANLDLDASPTGIQQRLEGRAEMTLREFAALHSFIAGRQR